MFKKRKKLKITLLVILALLLAGVFIANHYVKKNGYRNLWHFVKTWTSNKSLASDAKYETLEINIEPEDFEKLEAVRQKALKRGVLIDESGSYINAKLKHNGKKIKAKLRLKGHMTDHLQDKKWSFRIKTKKGDAFMGMKIFSIQHPGTRNYAYEWVYHQMMKQEGIIALQYDFINVKVNGEDWGIYALEEHFGQELVQRNKRPAGPVFRFNPDMYWAWRVNELEKKMINMETATMQAANIEPYDDDNVYADSVLLSSFQKGLALMESFRKGELKTSDVFDIDKLAKFHAIIDLVGGHHSLDWSDVKYYYNSVTRKMEPVAYESFSVRPANTLCGSYRFTSNKEKQMNELHSAIFSDPVFFERYVSELKRIASKKWLDAFLKKNKKQLNRKLAIVYTEFAHQNFETKPYYRNLKLIEKSLGPLKGIHAFVSELKPDSLFLSVAGIDALPFKLLAVAINGKNYPLEPVYIASKQKNIPVNYVTVRAGLPQPIIKKITSSTPLKLVYEVPGSGTKKETAISPASIESGQGDYFMMEPLLKPTDLSQIDFIQVDQESKIIWVAEGTHTLSATVVIGKGYKVIFKPNTTIDLVSSAGIFSYSPLMVEGSADFPVKFVSSDKTGKGIVILKTSGQSVISNARFESLGGVGGKGGNASLTAYEADLKINNCFFIDNKANDISVYRNKLSIANTTFSGCGNDAAAIHYGQVRMKNCTILNCKDEGVDAVGADMQVEDCSFATIGSCAVLCRSKTDMLFVRSTIKKANTGIEARDAAIINASNCEINDCRVALKASQKGDVFGPAFITAKKLKQSNNKVLKSAEKGSEIKITE